MRTLRQRISFAWFCIQHRRSLRAQRRYQSARLRELVRHLYAHIPLISELYRAHGVAPESVQTVDDLHRLPIISKSTFINRMIEEYIDSSRIVNTRWYVTSGTSGMPFRFLMSERGIDDTYTDFATFRFLWWRGESLSRLPLINIARIKIRSVPGPHRLFIPVKTYLNDPEGVLIKLRAFKTEIIYAYPSILLDLAQRLQAAHETLPDLKYALSFGEMLSPASRMRIAECLACDVYDRYGLEEIGVVGVECAMHNGFHINTESVIIEILDDNGNAVSEGMGGRVVATDLYNFGMPFIRYDTGDHGVVSSEPCACGLRSPRIWIRGRYSAYLSFPSRRIHHLEFDGAMDGFMHSVLQYQIVKRTNTQIIARIVPGPAYRDDTAAGIQRHLKDLVGPSVHVGIEIVDVIPVSEGGKSRIVADESVPASAIDNS